LLGSSGAQAFVWPSTVDRTGRELIASDVLARRRAARALMTFPPIAVKRLGLPALDDPDPDVRISALEALLAARAEGLAPRVTIWLGDTDATIRRAAAGALARLPSGAGVGALARVLADPDSAVRVAAARALGASGAPSAVAALLGRLDDTEPEVREAVVLALARLGDRSAVVPLVGKIQDARPGVRQRVARALGVLGDPRASSALALALRDPDETVRVAALEALGRLRAEDAVATIVSFLAEEKRPLVREAALAALAAIPSEPGLEALVRSLATDDPRERSPVRDALLAAGARAVPKLVLCLLGQPAVTQADGCALALGEIGGAEAADRIALALRKGVIRPQAGLRALSATREGRTLGTVLEYLSADDPWVRRAAIEATGALLDPSQPDGRAVEPLVRALDAAHERRSERAALVTLLGKTGSPRASPVLVAMARATDPMLQLTALRALAWIGRAGQDAVLVEALDDDRPSVRLAAAEALRRTGASRTAGLLLDRLERAAEVDRGAVALALIGPMAVTEDQETLGRVEALIGAVGGGDRDALIEALGAAPGAAAVAALERILSGGADRPTRAKIAEALGQHREGRGALRTLLRDPDAAVRANAVWSLGATGSMEDSAEVEALLGDRDAAVSGDAAGALGRMVTGPRPPAEALCRVLASGGVYTRINALAGLRSARVRCGAGVERALLSSDPADGVRAAAAALIFAVASPEPALDRAALGRCEAEDLSGDVAAACRTAPRGVKADAAAVSVYVVPSGATVPVPRAPFALIRADGFVRLGLTDRRGSVYEHDAPRGVIRLGVPAALAF
jgi:HEAT repeat protein